MSADAEASTSTWSWAPFADADTDDAIWRVSVPGPTVNIVWNSGPNEADGRTFARIAPHATEMKFFTPPVPPATVPAGPAAKTFTGFTRSNAGTFGSLANCSGSGTSGSVAGALVGTNWVANWRVSASGVWATAPAVGSYESAADADDPVTITHDDLAGLPAGTDRFRLYLPVGLEGLGRSEGGSGGLSVSYETSDGDIDLFSMSADSQGVTVGGSEPDFLSIYRVRELHENPMALAERPWRLSDLQDSLGILMKHDVLRAPFRFGFLLDGIPVPTTDIAAGGVVAQFHVRTSVADAGAGEGGDYGEQQQRAPRG